MEQITVSYRHPIKLYKMNQRKYVMILSISIHHIGSHRNIAVMVAAHTTASSIGLSNRIRFIYEFYISIHMLADSRKRCIVLRHISDHTDSVGKPL